MNKIRYYLLLILLPLLLSSCLKRVPLIQETQFEIDYRDKKEILELHNCDFFEKLEGSELDSISLYYLQYLFTYMPLSDFADYDYEFFVRQVEFAVAAKTNFAWGADIPEDIFIHYVLPPRVNNENLDTARMVFYRELQERLSSQELDIEQAVLEINHWCNEKVIYRGTDERTISPLAAVRSGFGRCGEESTFTVTALRAAGIPARQVYVPRWSHTDDNHAWVEVWINGEWKFLGACEPAPVLNTGWFIVPASRAMLVHTKQFGNCDKANPKFMTSTKNYSWINSLSSYAQTKKLFVVVLNESNIPVRNADVEFLIYNYAEMYSIFKTKTNYAGLVKFETGYGSLDIFAKSKDYTAYYNLSPNETGLIKIQLNASQSLPNEDLEYYPPDPSEFKPLCSDAEKICADRIKDNDIIRQEYEKAFYNERRAKDFVETFLYPAEAGEFLINSRGNWFETESFLIECSYKNLHIQALELLQVLSEKDLRDTKSSILMEHLDYALKNKNRDLPHDIFINYVLNPRIKFEVLKTYRKVILSDLDSTQVNQFINNPNLVSDYVLSQIKTSADIGAKSFSGDVLNSYLVPISPSGVHKLKLSDNKSLQIYLVAFYRSLGVPARIDNGNQLVQYYKNGNWHDVALTDNTDKNEIKKSLLSLINGEPDRELKYRIHFSLAKLIDGNYKTVDLGWEIPTSEFENGLLLEIGEYMLLTSMRKEDGTVLVNRKFFSIEENLSVELFVKLPMFNEKSDSYSSFNHANIYDKHLNPIDSKSFAKQGKFAALCWLDPGKEPSKHIIRDLNPMLDELNKRGIKVIYIVPNQNFNPSDYGYPVNVDYYIDTDLSLLNHNKTCSSSQTGNNFPAIFLIDSKSNILYTSTGYIIAVGEMMINKVGVVEL